MEQTDQRVAYEDCKHERTSFHGVSCVLYLVSFILYLLSCIYELLLPGCHFSCIRSGVQVPCRPANQQPQPRSRSGLVSRQLVDPVDGPWRENIVSSSSAPLRQMLRDGDLIKTAMIQPFSSHQSVLQSSLPSGPLPR